MIVNILLIFLGFILLIKGADYLVEGASNIAKKFHIPEIIIGLTIVSIGTSMPELVVSVNSALQGHSDIAVGNVVGSNIVNLLLILGSCAVIKPLEFKRETRLFESPITIVCAVLFFIMSNSGNYIVTRYEGIILLFLCALFIVYNIYMAKNGDKIDMEEGLEEKRDVEIVPTWKSVINIVIGIIALKFGGDFVVNNAVEVATALGISETLISLTIVAIGTSLPELITSITATRKSETDMAIGNILGSNIFNILLILGVSATLCPINYSIIYNADFILLIIGSVMLAAYPFIGKKNYMGRVQGTVFVAMYALYILSAIYTK